MEQNIEKQTIEPTTPAAGWQKSENWIRGLYMLLFMICFAVGQALLNLTAFVQFLWLLFAGEPNRGLASFGTSLAVWIGDVARFLTAATEEKPFPWAAWPAAR